MAQPQGQFNPFDFGFVNPTAQLINAGSRVGYGGTKGGGLQFLGNVLAGLGSLRSGGLIGVGSTIADRVLTQRNIKEITEQQAAKDATDRLNEYQKLFEGKQDNIRKAKAQGLNTDGYYGTTPFTNDEVKNIYGQNTIPALNKLLQGEALQIPEGGQVDPELLRNYLKQQSDVAQARDFSQTQLPQQFLPKPGVYAQPNAQPQGNMPMLENPLAGLQGAVSQAQVQDPITQRSPFLQYSLPPVDQMRPIEERRQRDAQQETMRHNKADEALKAKRIDKMGSGGSGRAPNMLELMTPEQRTAYFNKTAGLGPPEVQPLTSSALKFGQELWSAIPNKRDGDEKTYQSRFNRYNEWASRYGQPMAVKPTFGGGSQAKLNNAGAKATTPKGKSSAIPGLRFE